MSTTESQSRQRQPLTTLSRPLRSFLATESGGAGMLLAAAVVALLWSNSPWSASYEALWATEMSLEIGTAGLSMDLEHWVNDGLMALFFFVIGLEVRREISVGELTDRRRATIPLIAGVGGMLVPAAIYLALNPTGPASAGWGIVIGTDTAFLLGALAVVGPRFSTQLRIFLLTLTVIDDIVAVSVIGVVYSDHFRPLPLLLAALCLAAIAWMSRHGTWRASPFVLVGLVLWLAIVEAGLHASIAGMLGGLLVAAHEPDRATVETAASGFRAFRQSPLVTVGRSARQQLDQAISVNERLQSALHPWTSYVIVPAFALANAGVDLRDGVLGAALASPVTWGVVAGLVLGKLVGIGGTAMLARRAGLGAFPQGVGTGHVWGGAALSGIGFTVSLLIAGLAFEGELREQATVGVLLAAVGATAMGWLMFWIAGAVRGEGDADLPRVLDRPVSVDDDHIRGPVDAPLTLVEYGDFECPFCAKATGVARELRARFGDDRATCSATSPSTTPIRTRRPPPGPPSQPGSRAGSGTCTTGSSPTRTSSRSPTSSATRRAWGSTSTPSPPTSTTRLSPSGSTATRRAPRPAAPAAPRPSSSATSGTPEPSTPRPWRRSWSGCGTGPGSARAGQAPDGRHPPGGMPPAPGVGQGQGSGRGVPGVPSGPRRTRCVAGSRTPATRSCWSGCSTPRPTP
jgi:Na+/H+ antiporter NhaA